MQATAAKHTHRADPLHGLDASIESKLGADIRLIYGVGIPMLFVIGLILALVRWPSYWLVAGALVPELACLGFIITKLNAMLDEPDRTE